MVRTPPELEDEEQNEEFDGEEEEPPVRKLDRSLQSVNDVWVITHAKQVSLNKSAYLALLLWGDLEGNMCPSAFFFFFLQKICPSAYNF